MVIREGLGWVPIRAELVTAHPHYPAQVHVQGRGQHSSSFNRTTEMLQLNMDNLNTCKKKTQIKKITHLKMFWCVLQKWSRPNKNINSMKRSHGKHADPSWLLAGHVAFFQEPQFIRDQLEVWRKLHESKPNNLNLSLSVQLLSSR